MHSCYSYSRCSNCRMNNSCLSFFFFFLFFAIFIFHLSVVMCDMLKILLKLEFVDSSHSRPHCGLFPVSGNKDVSIAAFGIHQKTVHLSVLGTAEPPWRQCENILRLFAAPAERKTPEECICDSSPVRRRVTGDNVSRAALLWLHTGRLP